MDDTIDGLNNMMRGMNFVATFGDDVLKDCKTLEAAEAAHVQIATLAIIVVINVLLYIHKQ